MSKIHLKYDSASGFSNNQVIKYNTTESGATTTRMYETDAGLFSGGPTAYTYSFGGEYSAVDSDYFTIGSNSRGANTVLTINAGAYPEVRFNNNFYGQDMRIYGGYNGDHLEIAHTLSSGRFTYVGDRNIGIGFDGGYQTPKATLDIRGAGDTSASTGLSITNSAGTSMLLVRNDGNVGVGTSSPTTKLHVYGGVMMHEGTSFTTPGTPTSYLFRLHDTGIGNPYFGVGSNGTSAYVQSWNSMPIRINSQGNDVYIGTANVFQNTGNVGIGTTSPTSKLHVNGTARVTPSNATWDFGWNAGELYVRGTANGEPIIKIHTTSSTEYMEMLNPNNPSGYNGWRVGRDVNDFKIKGNINNDVNGVVTDVFTILGSNGNVGIGTTSPLYKLHVNGGTFVNGDVNITGNVNIVGTATTINTQTLQTADNKILLNYSGTNLTSIGGGISILSGKTDGQNVELITDVNGDWTTNTGLKTYGRTNDNTSNSFTALNSGGTELLTVRNNGFVGINSPSPSTLLNIKGNGSTDLLQVIQNDSTPYFEVGNNGYTTTRAFNVGFGNAGIALQNFVTNVGSNFTFQKSGDIFYLSYGGSDKWVVLNTGDISIGSGTNPTARLHIKGASSGSSDYALKVDNSGSTSLLQVVNNGSVQIGKAYNSGWDNDNFIDIISPNADSTFKRFTYGWWNGSTFDDRCYIGILPDSISSNTFKGYLNSNSISVFDTLTLVNRLNSGKAFYMYWDEPSSGQYNLSFMNENSGRLFSFGSNGNMGIGFGGNTDVIDEKLVVNGKTKTTQLQITSGAANGYILTSDASGNTTWSPVSGVTGVGTVTKYSTTLTTPSSNVTNTITHNLGTTDITVTLWLVTTGDMTSARITNRQTNSVDVIFASAPGENVRVVITG